MPFALLIIGLLLVVSGFQNTHKELGSQIASEFTGSNNFIYWTAAIVGVGALGYIKPLEPFSRMFLALIIVSIFLAKKGFFNQFQNAIGAGSAPTLNSSNPITTPLQFSNTSNPIATPLL